MRSLTLYIGNKNYSSWSLRPWMLLRHLQLPFEEVQIPLDTPDFASRLTRMGVPARVPVLRHGELVIWDSLAICEYAMELTGRGLPRAVAARVAARSASAEMHAGFTALRETWPLNSRARDRRTQMRPALQADITRIDWLWNSLRSLHGQGGPWLCGEYSLVDAMFAPVVLRFVTYGAQLSPDAESYLQSALADPILKDWLRAAQREPWTLPQYEVGDQANEASN